MYLKYCKEKGVKPSIPTQAILDSADKEIADFRRLKIFQRNGIEKLQCMNQELEEALRMIMSTQEEEGLCDSDEALSQIYLIAEKSLR